MTTPAVVLPGQRLTAGRLNEGLLIGRLVFVAYRDASQSISDAIAGIAANALSWDNIALDVLGGWDPAQPTRFTPPIGGWFKLTGGGSFNGSTSGTIRGASWLLNGALPAAGTARPHASSSIASTSLTADARELPAQLDGSGDYVELAPFQDTGGTLDTSTGSTRPYIAVYYSGPA